MGDDGECGDMPLFNGVLEDQAKQDRIFFQSAIRGRLIVLGALPPPLLEVISDQLWSDFGDEPCSPKGTNRAPFGVVVWCRGRAVSTAGVFSATIRTARQ
jgi:hypothetical protein